MSFIVIAVFYFNLQVCTNVYSLTISMIGFQKRRLTDNKLRLTSGVAHPVKKNVSEKAGREDIGHLILISSFMLQTSTKQQQNNNNCMTVQMNQDGLMIFFSKYPL